ncbi:MULTISPECIES: hypothetical protein [unclassified Pseudomonas]|uniref:hypothetical protein n=1 Tax=unclassified Pseudomonas TaxID=196821 RepID=UPI000C88D082|nr:MULTISPECIES: hypothetical protein [unclassified Pseudomonas]PMZ99428.1 hypothetical protein C1X79_07950 [Pseudomonas sp. FW305-42]PNA23183.1 hypothetical protein C1X78_14300 [Pseudomonas sp. MPR-R1B]PNB25813.1 hypothetical protein C1X80_12930 [Pseudomonas sp. DP16D-E2]PNB41809.1 hypothetical protein C1X75_18910 [Pseudomonas sp. FW305-17]PNB60804.1 hypothetical protein C1X77_13470 [Pseudomonas sp. GW531-E2]
MSTFNEGIKGTLEFKALEVDALLDDGYDELPELLPGDRLGDDLHVIVPWWPEIVVDDHIALVWDEEILEAEHGANHRVEQYEAQDPKHEFELTLPASYWRSVGEGEESRFSLGYAVRPSLSTVWEHGPSRFVRVDRLAPGGEEGALGKMVFPKALEDRGVILESDFEQGVLWATISGYLHQALGDTITVSMTDGIERVSAGPFTVDSEREATPIALPQAQLQTLVGGIPVSFTYQVLDRAGNESALSLAHDSLVLEVVQPLPAPRVAEADEAGNLDFSLLGDADVLVYLDPDDRWVVGQAVTLVWVGMTANGSRLAPVIKHGQLKADGVECSLENAHAAAVLQGDAHLVYRIDESGLGSDPRVISIIGSLELEAPEVDEAAEGALDPEDVPPQGATIRIKAYPHMAKGDQLLLEWKGMSAAGDPHDLSWTLDVQQVGDLEQQVGKDEVDVLDGGRVTLFHTLTAVGGALSGSANCDLRVGRVAFPRPEVEKAFGDDKDQLDFNRDFVGASHVKVTVRQYAGMVGDQVAVVLEVPDLAYQSPWKDVVGPADLVFEVPAGVVMHGIGHRVPISYRILRGDQEETSDVLELNIHEQLLDMQAPRYMSFAGQEPKFIVRYHEVKSGDQVDIHWQVEGELSRSATAAVFKDATYWLVSIEPGWVDADEGKTVYANYSIVPKVGEKRQFSPVHAFKPK